MLGGRVDRPSPVPLVDAIGVEAFIGVHDSRRAAGLESEVIAALSASPLAVVRIKDAAPRAVWRLDVTTDGGGHGVRVTATLVDQRDQTVRWSQAFNVSEEGAATDRRSAARLIAMGVRFSVEGPGAVPPAEMLPRRPRAAG